MPVFTRNVLCRVTPYVGTDVYGAPVAGATRTEKCAVVKLTQTTQHTTVRADSGATRGHADEEVADAVLLFSKQSTIGLGDHVVVSGVSLRVASIRQRFDVMSRLDHFEVRCAIE